MKKKKEVKEKKIVKEMENPVKDDDSLKRISIKRQMLIDEVRSKLLPNSMLKRGGPAVRVRHSQECSQWSGVISEINELGKKIGLRPIGLGHLRK